MNALLIAALGSILAVGQPATTNHAVKSGRGAATAVESNDPVEQEYQKLLEADDAAQEEVDKWIRDNNEFAAKGAGVPKEEMTRRIQARFDPVRKAYEDFIRRHPEHAKVRVAYGSFLGDLGDEEGSQQQWEKALSLDPKDPAVYNNLANLYGHVGPVKKSFEYYAKALQLNPNEPVYYHNFGTTVYLFRKDAQEFYGITEQEIFNMALGLYHKALKLDPENFPLASDVAQTFYGIKPTRTEDALAAWKYALRIAHDDLEREGVYIHLARFKLNAGRFDEARQDLSLVTNTAYAELKRRVNRSLEERKQQSKTTNAPVAPAAPAQQR